MQQLAVELDATRRADDAREAAAFAEMAARIRRMANAPSFEELSERRGEPERAARARAQAQRCLGVA